MFTTTNACLLPSEFPREASWSRLPKEDARQSVLTDISEEQSGRQSKGNTQQIFLIELTQIITEHFFKESQPKQFLKYPIKGEDFDGFFFKKNMFHQFYHPKKKKKKKTGE